MKLYGDIRHARLSRILLAVGVAVLPDIIA